MKISRAPQNLSARPTKSSLMGLPPKDPHDDDEQNEEDEDEGDEPAVIRETEE